MGTEENHPEVTPQVKSKAMNRHFLGLSIGQIIAHKECVMGKKKCVTVVSYVFIQYH